MKPSSPCERLLRRRGNALARALVRLRSDVRNAAALRRARVATRRLREAVPIVAEASAVEPRKLAKLEQRLRRLTRALGPVRELDVTIALLDELATRHGDDGGSIRMVRQVLQRQRKRRRRTLAAALEAKKFTRLPRNLRALARACRVPAFPAVHGQRSTTLRHRSTLPGTRLVRRAERLRAAIDLAGTIYTTELLHAVRIALKKLRYTLELAHEAGLHALLPTLHELKRLQRTLGRMHDLQVLLDRTRTVQIDVGRPHGPAWEALDRLGRTLENEVHRLHARYVAARLELLLLCERLHAGRALRSGNARRPVLKASIGPRLSDGSRPNPSPERRGSRKGTAAAPERTRLFAVKRRSAGAHSAGERRVSVG